MKAITSILSCASLVLAAGCATGSRVQRDAKGEVVVIGDWNDVEAAAIVGVQGQETVIVGQHATDQEQVFELLSIQDERGMLTARREGAGTDLIPIHLTCTMGLFGNVERENAVLSGTAKRLKDLAGVEWRPR